MMIYNSATLEALSELIKELENDLDIKIELEFDDTFKCRIIKNAKCIKEFNYPKFLLARLTLDLQQYSQELEEKRKEKEEDFMFEVAECIGEFAKVFRFMRELENRFQIKFNIQKDAGIAKIRIEAIRLATSEMIDAFEYHIVESKQLKADMEDLEEKLIENERTGRAKEVVKFLDDYARSRGWDCYFRNLEVCKSSGILRAVLISCKEKHPRFVSFYLENSIETIKKQIEGIRLN